MPDAKRREREVAELIIDQQTGEDVTQSPYRRAMARLVEVEAENKMMRLDLRSADIAVHEAAVALELVDTQIAALKEERTHLATMLEIAAEDAWHDSFTIDPLDDYSETWLICLGVRADKKEQK